jgi:hypothetical protein
MIDLSPIRVLWRQPDTLALWGVPYDMRPGQQPGDLWRARQAYRPPRYGVLASPRISLSDWVYLGSPGWWGSMPREDQASVKEWLTGRDAPGGPGEWSLMA